MNNTGTEAPTLETLAALLDAEHDAMLRKTAEHLLWDWRAAAGIVHQTRERAIADFHRFDPALRPLVTWVHCIRLRLAIAYMRVNGLLAPVSPDEPPFPTWTEEEAALMREKNPELLKHWERVVEAHRASQAEYGDLEKRIETLPAVLREPCRLWLGDKPVPESLGWYVRQGLTLLGRRKAAA